MRKFNTIKKSRKKSKDIDEKIEYLNKECRKTGLNEITMSTSGIYQGSKEIPNSTYSNFNSASFNGKSLGHSGADGSGNGGAYTGKVIASEHGLDPVAHSSILGLEGVAVSPPHPVSGRRRYASTRTGMVSWSPTQPGKIQGNSDVPTGSVMWIWNPNANNSDGTSGNWYPLEFDVHQQKWGFWDSNFLGFGFLNTNLSQLELPGSGNVGASIISLFNSIGITDKNNIGTPETTVLTQNNLDDPSFIPIDIGGLSNQGYEYLKNKTSDNYLAGVYDLMKRGQVPFLTPDQVNKILVDPKYQQLLQDDPDIIKQLQRMRAMADDGTEIASTDPSAAFPSAPPVPPDPSDAPSVSVDSTEDAKPNVKDAKLGTWMSRQDFIQTYPDSNMVDYLSSLPYRATDFMTPNPNFPGAWDLNKKGYENYFMNGDLSALGNREGKPEPRNANTTVVPPRTVAPASASKPTGFLDTILSAGADAVGRGAAKDVFDYYMDKVEKGHNGGEHNINNLLGRSTRAIERWYARNKTNIVTAREGGKSIFHDAAQQDFMHLSQTDGNLKNITGNLDLARGDGIFDKGDTLEIIKHYDFDGERDLAGGGVVGNLGSKGYAKSKGIMKYLGDDGTKTSPLMKLVITIDQKTGTVKTSVKESLDESVKLGHFEPEALTVDLEKLRKGILPEFPKDPPPKLINGYSEKSKLLPKIIEGEPFIKVDKKVLAKNHRLKDSEIKEFMDEINMINEYIKQNPAELIHAMQRYPKHDPRLAQLNWQMDQKLQASQDYMETHFPENERLFNKLQRKIKQNIDLTDPNKFKGHKEAPKFDQTAISEQERRRPTSGLMGVEAQQASVKVNYEFGETENVSPPSYNQKEKRLKEEIKQIKAEYEKWKSNWRDDIKLDEGMTTSGLYKVVLPAAGDTDLDGISLGVSGGHAPVDYGTSLSNSEEDPNTIPDGTEYTALTNLEPMNSVAKGNENDWNATTQEAEYYWLVRTFDQATQTWKSHTNGGDNGMYSSLVPGFKTHTMRNVQLSGRHSTRDMDHPTDPGGYHPTSTFGSNDEVGQPYTSSSNKTTGAGVVLTFSGPGSPRFAALKPVDATQLDTIKVHGLVSDTNLVRNGAHSAADVDCRPQIYYWAGNHPDFKKSYLNGSIATMSNGKNVTSDGWRPINMKPNGDIDPSVDPFIIKYREDEDASGNKNRAPGYTPARYNETTDSMDPPIYSAGHMRVYPYSLKLPEWTQTKGARFMIIQHFESFSPGGSSFHVSGVRYQRKNAITSFARLDDPQASSFIRVGQGAGNQSAQQRRKKVRDMIKASIKYGKTKFGDGLVNSTNID